MNASPPIETPTFPSQAGAHVPAWRNTETIAPRAQFRLNARQGGEFGIEWTLNGVASQHHDGMDSEALPPAQVLPRGEWSRVRFANDSSRIHPMHIHGMFFRVLHRNDQPVDEPFFRDTVLVHPHETVDIGVVPLEQGRWMIHCHIFEHAESGMMSLLDVRPNPPR